MFFLFFLQTIQNLMIVEFIILEEYIHIWDQN